MAWVYRIRLWAIDAVYDGVMNAVDFLERRREIVWRKWAKVRGF